MIREGTPRIAILMTCHNRKALTLRCLRALRDEPLFFEENLFLVDDGSSDGTGMAVLDYMPSANVIEGSGSLFWNGGMRLAWESALKSGRRFDFYLWLNDDVELRPGVLTALVADAAQAARADGAVIVVAATVEPGTDRVTYGGQRRPTSRRPLRFNLVQPNGAPQPVDTVSGNIVLVSDAAERVVGNLSDGFIHIYGDLDYGLRAGRAGVPMVLASGVGGACAANSHGGGSLDASLGRWQRLRLRWKESGKIHGRDWSRFTRIHSGLGRLSVLYSVSPYLRILLGKPK